MGLFLGGSIAKHVPHKNTPVSILLETGVFFLSPIVEVY